MGCLDRVDSTACYRKAEPRGATHGEVAALLSLLAPLDERQVTILRLRFGLEEGTPGLSKRSAGNGARDLING